MTARRVRFDIRQTGRALVLVLGIGLVLNLVVYMFLVRPKVGESRAVEDGSDRRLVELKSKREVVEAREAYVAKLQQPLTWQLTGGAAIHDSRAKSNR